MPSRPKVKAIGPSPALSGSLRRPTCDGESPQPKLATDDVRATWNTARPGAAAWPAPPGCAAGSELAVFVLGDGADERWSESAATRKRTPVSAAATRPRDFVLVTTASGRR